MGAEIKGQSGFINLMKMKSSYFDLLFKELEKEIDETTKDFPDFKEELFEKLYTFFKTYFSESGSVYFSYTPLKSKVYDKIYTSNHDVILFWKTRMLYYVKTDRLWNNLRIDYDSDGVKYVVHFDVSELEHKMANEKRDLVYELKDVKGKELTIAVFYSERGRKTKLDDIIKDLKGRSMHLDQETLSRIFRIFAKQNEVDYFINKNAEQFLKEQFAIWLKTYVLDDESVFDAKRLSQLKVLKNIAYEVIGFVSRFENELARIWNKPKFSLKSNYVIALRTLRQYLANKDWERIKSDVIKNVKENQRFREELESTVKEVYNKPLQNLYVKNAKFEDNRIVLSYVKRFEDRKERDDLIRKNGKGSAYEKLGEKNGKEVTFYYADYYSDTLIPHVDIERIYIDTQFFDEDFKLRLLSLISEKECLDKCLDGYLIKSDSYHALRTILPKFKEKIQLIYIDPPFNTEDSGFIFVDKFFDSSWLTMMENRVNAALPLLRDDGALYIHTDSNCNYLARYLLDTIFEGEPRREIVWNTSESPSGLKAPAPNWIRQHDTILFYSKDDKPPFKKMWRYNGDRKVEGLGWLDIFKDDNDICYVEKHVDNERTLKRVDLKEIEDTVRIGDVWNDIYSMMYTQNMTRENWGEDSTQKPENLLRRIIQASSNSGDYVMDFFCGSGTTLAAAHKLGRKWIGVEMGSFFEDIILKRMRAVVFGDVRPKLSQDLGWQGGGFFKYYQLEQYEQILGKAIYKQSTPFFDGQKKDSSDFHQYLFMKDPKLLEAMELDYKTNKVNLDFSKIYLDIDLAETLSNLTGQLIKGVGKNFVQFDAGEKIDYKNIDFNLVKWLIWW